MFLLINGTRHVKNRSNFGEVDVAPVPCLSPRPTSPHLPPADLGENMCRVSKRPALNYMKTCNHKVPTIVYIHLRSVNEKKFKNKFKNHIQSTCTAADPGETMCKVSKRPVWNCMRSCIHKVPTVCTAEVRKWQNSKSTKKWQK